MKSVSKPLNKNVIFDELKGSSVKIVSDKYKSIKKIENLILEKNNLDYECQINDLKSKNKLQYEQLQFIYNSKRFRAVNIIANLFNKLRGRK